MFMLVNCVAAPAGSFFSAFGCYTCFFSKTQNTFDCEYRFQGFYKINSENCLFLKKKTVEFRIFLKKIGRRGKKATEA
jgi:hypothetical protein